MAKYVVQAIFLVWSILLYLAFLHAAYKVDHLLRTMPSSMLTRDNSNVHQKGSSSHLSSLSFIVRYIRVMRFADTFRSTLLIVTGIMQLAILAPYSNLATSVAAALVPTLLGPKIRGTEESEPANMSKIVEEAPAEEGNVNRILLYFYITLYRIYMYSIEYYNFRIANHDHRQGVQSGGTGAGGKP